jgi:hypothetical protein
LIVAGGSVGSGGTTGFGGMGGRVFDAAVDRSIVGFDGRGVDGTTDRRSYAPETQTLDTQLDSAAYPVALSIVPTPLDFGSVTLFGSSSLALTVRNLRAASTAITFGGISGSADFSLAGGSCQKDYPQLSAGEACTILVKFAPTSVGSKSATLWMKAYWTTETPENYDSEEYSPVFFGTAIVNDPIDAAPAVDVGEAVGEAGSDGAAASSGNAGTGEVVGSGGAASGTGGSVGTGSE